MLCVCMCVCVYVCVWTGVCGGSGGVCECDLELSNCTINVSPS